MSEPGRLIPLATEPYKRMALICGFIFLNHFSLSKRILMKTFTTLIPSSKVILFFIVCAIFRSIKVGYILLAFLTRQALKTPYHDVQVMLGILTVNLGGTRHIEKLEPLIKAIKRLQPDILLLQEVTDVKEGIPSILTSIKEAAQYSYYDFEKSHDYSLDYGKGVLQKEKLIEGLGMISKIRFDKERFDLPILKGLDRWPRIAVRYSNKEFSLCHVHLSKYTESRKACVAALPDTNIYAGDFNMQPEEFKTYFKGVNSWDVKHYVSFPSKGITLDYVFVKKGKISQVETTEIFSDHLAIFITIK